MSGFVVSDGKVRKISIKRGTLEKIATLLGITQLELKQGTSIVTVSTPRAPGKPQAKRKRAQRK